MNVSFSFITRVTSSKNLVIKEGRQLSIYDDIWYLLFEVTCKLVYTFQLSYDMIPHISHAHRNNALTRTSNKKKKRLCVRLDSVLPFY